MRILHLVAGNLFGGIETFVLDLATTTGSRHQHQVAIAYEGRLATELRARGHEPVMLGDVRLSRPWTVLTARRTLNEWMKANRVDRVVAHGGWPLAIFGACARRASVRLQWFLHNAFDDNWLDQLAVRAKPDVVLGCSKFVVESARKAFPHVPSHVAWLPLNIHPAKDGDRVAARQEFGVAADAVVIVMVSRMQAWKGHAPLLAALRALRDQPDWSAWIVGGAQREEDQRYVQTLTAQAEADGTASRVKFIGERRDVGRILAGADIFCQPNLGPEGFGLVFVEAAAASLPVVTTAFGGALDILNDDMGALIPPGNHALLVERLRALITDPALRRACGDRANLGVTAKFERKVLQAQLDDAFES